MKIIDAFTYYNEIDVLKLRLEELNDCVDYFVIVEGSLTFSGHKKPLHFNDVPSWIDRFSDKIIRYTVDDWSNNMTSWDREKHQRNGILKAVSFVPNIGDDDKIFISDADEIWNKSILEIMQGEPVKLNMNQYFWNLNLQVPSHCNQGSRPVVLKYGQLRSTTPQLLREMDMAIVGNPGWHFSFLNPLELGRSKVEAFAHTEYDEERFKDKSSIEYRIEYGIDPFDRFPLKYTPVDHTYPEYVRNNIKDVSHLLYNGKAFGERVN